MVLPTLVPRLLALLCSSILARPGLVWSWGEQGHEAINLAAWVAVEQKQEMSSFFRSPSSKKSLVYKANDPDRWKDALEPILKAGQDPEHFFDIEPIIDSGIPPTRYFALELYRQKGVKPEEVGFLPYAIMETYGKLRLAFRELRTRQDDKAFLQPAAIHHAGVLGHYVGDGSQPLHITIHHHGWVGPNPLGFTTDRSIHRRFEDDFVRLHVPAEEVVERVSPPRVLDNPFQEVTGYLMASHNLVNRLYELEKKGAFAPTAESRRFVLERLAAGGQMLANLWYTAWVRSAEQ